MVSRDRDLASSVGGDQPRTEIDLALESALLSLLQRRADGATVCPSEAAREVGTQGEGPGDETWRALMEPARAAARRLVAAGQVEITQGGRAVDSSTARGPIRVRLVVMPGRD
ncbi:DUF3253 domain-containing protein [soil metagenome]